MRAITHLRSRRGFTLIELLAVIMIIAVLAAIIIPVVGKVRQSASKATMTSNLRQISQAIMTFSNDNRGSLPGLYVPGSDFGGLNASYGLTTGQSAYSSPSVRSTLQSNDQLGRYITSSVITIDGQNKQYCALLESPSFASQRPQGVFPTSVELATTIADSNGTLVYPFGSKTLGLMSMKYRAVVSATNVAKRWMLIEVDKTTPATVDATLSGAGWYGGLPDQPVHGTGWLAAFYDGHVEMLNPADSRLNNRTAL